MQLKPTYNKSYLKKNSFWQLTTLICLKQELKLDHSGHNQSGSIKQNFKAKNPQSKTNYFFLRQVIVANNYLYQIIVQCKLFL